MLVFYLGNLLNLNEKTVLNVECDVNIEFFSFFKKFSVLNLVMVIEYAFLFDTGSCTRFAYLSRYVLKMNLC